MRNKHKLTVLAVAMASAGLLQMAVVAPAAAQTPSLTDLQKQIQALEQQIESLQQQVNNAQSSADNLQKMGGPINKDHPGFWKIPGTDTWMTLAGHIKLDAMYDRKQSVGPQTDFSAIPMIGAPGSDRTGNVQANAKQSYLYLETHTPTPYGDLEAHFATDFYLSTQGNPNISNSYAMRLRNAYGVLGEWTFGQDWSAFQDTAAGPNALDFNGPAGQVFIRQPQLRWTHAVKGKEGVVDQYIVSVENPSGDFFAPAGLYNGNSTNIDQDGQTADPAGCTLGRVTPCQNGPSQLAKFPDLIGRWEHDAAFGHVSFQALARKISVDTGSIGVPPDQVVKTDKWGFGIGASAVINMNQVEPTLGNDQVFFSLQGGPGIGRYLQDLLFNGAILNDNTHQLDLMSSLGGFIAYEHFWPGDQWETNLIYGYEKTNLKDVDQLIADGAQLTKRSQSVHLNLIWHPVPNTTFGIETSLGKREVGGFIPPGQQDHGYMERFQFTGVYSF
ncbi:MAG: porin [Betaproteobacteria bacterium]|nr:porin [Betaproteobacteria bacterium]MDE2209160.1 porin [Betaproteobacteria bacterium]